MYDVTSCLAACSHVPPGGSGLPTEGGLPTGGGGLPTGGGGLPTEGGGGSAYRGDWADTLEPETRVVRILL